MIFVDPSSNLHPYECDGPGRCIHCDRTVSDEHDPSSCALCEPESPQSRPTPTPRVALQMMLARWSEDECEDWLDAEAVAAARAALAELEADAISEPDTTLDER